MTDNDNDIISPTTDFCKPVDKKLIKVSYKKWHVYFHNTTDIVELLRASKIDQLL